jgi:hypothetical protein
MYRYKAKAKTPLTNEQILNNEGQVRKTGHTSEKVLTGGEE